MLETVCAFSLVFSKFKTSRLSYKLLKTCICIPEIRGGVYWRQLVHFPCTSQSLRFVDFLTKYFKHVFAFLKLGGGILETVRAFSLDFSKFNTSRLSYKILKRCICISEIRGGGMLETACAFALHFSKFKICRLSHKIL